MTELTGTQAQEKTIDLYALLGEFALAKGSYRIRYASTFGRSGRASHDDLLHELTPVREKLNAAELRDLSSLLQRDLNDTRVAGELIPYLKGDRAQIGFFPAVLAVLVPKGFFQGEEDISYPVPEVDDDGTRTNYGACWTIEQFQLGGEPVPLGKLQIKQRNTDVIVLDGQHRASAFRYLTGDWDLHGTIYETFYKTAGEPEPLEADLPVTVIWFEAKDDTTVEPRQISRELFVDVNNSAKPVSEARTILLDDRSVTTVGVQQVYSLAADEGFSTSSFSLLFSAFDMDSDLAQGKLPLMSLTSPEIVYEALNWALFCNEGWKQLGQWRVQRKRSQTNTDRLAALLGSGDGIERGTDADDNLRYFFSDPATASKFSEEFRAVYVPAFAELLSGLEFLKPHYKAAALVEAWIKEDAPATPIIVWEKIFTGGEGLYWNFRAGTSEGGAAWRQYKDAIDTIEASFSEARAEVYGASKSDVDSVYRSFATKAFLTGTVMAMDYLFDNGHEETFDAAAAALIGRLNDFSLAEWRTVFIDLRPLLIRGTDPKAWPAYRNLLLRMYDGESWEVLDRKRMNELPEWQVLKNVLRDRANALARTSTEMPDEDAIRRQVKESLPQVKEVFTGCGLDSDVLDARNVTDRAVKEMQAWLREEFLEEDG